MANFNFSEYGFWSELEASVSRFEQDWSCSKVLDFDKVLSGVEATNREEVLIHLAKLDQEKRWNAGCSQRVEYYLDRWPFVAGNSRMVRELSRSETQLRIEHDQAPIVDELLSRFPGIVDETEIVQWLRDGSVNGESSVSVSDGLVADPSEFGHSSTPIPGFAYAPGEMLGRYRLLSILGRGGMGIVYLAEDAELDRNVAVKILHKDRLGGKAPVSMLLREARTAAKLEHDAILPVFDFGQNDDGCQFIVMEYVDGPSVEEMIQAGSLTSEKSIRLVARVAEGLAAAHADGFVHRDIKPSNILVKLNGTLRVADFGLATSQQDSGDLVLSGTIP